MDAEAAETRPGASGAGPGQSGPRGVPQTHPERARARVCSRVARDALERFDCRFVPSPSTNMILSASSSLAIAIVPSRLICRVTRTPTLSPPI